MSDFTCDYLESQDCACSGCSCPLDDDSTPAPSPEAGTCYTIMMTDTWGDGWGDIKWYWASMATGAVQVRAAHAHALSRSQAEWIYGD